MPNANERLLQDATLRKAAALPNAANTTTTASIDLGPQPYNATEDLVVRIDTIQATGANSKNITITVQDSDEPAASFAAVAGLGPLVIAGNTTAYPATVRKSIKLPTTTKRYIRISATGEANGGDAGDGTMTLSVVG